MKRHHASSNALVLVTGVLAFLASTIEAHAKKLLEPLPLRAVTAFRNHVVRSRVDLSPDGQWVAHTYMSGKKLPRATWLYSTTGVSFGDGDGRMQALLTNTRTGEVIRLCSEKSSSWAPVWSPDGQRVAFYSDEGGEAGLWIWEKATRQARRFANVIVRPVMSYDVARWSADGRRLLVKILSEGVTVAQANAMMPMLDEARRFPVVKEDEPSVLVFRAEPTPKASADTAATAANTPPVIEDAGEYRRVADLALLDLDTGGIQRIAPRSGPSWWAFSPDERYVAYTVHKGIERDTEQPVYDLVAHDLAAGKMRVVTQFRGYSGRNVSWSPDGKHLAFLTSGHLAGGEVFVVPATGGAPRRLGSDKTPDFSTHDIRPPCWDARGENLYLVKGESLWRLEVESGRAAEAARLPGRRLGGIIAAAGASSFWSPDSRSLVVNTTTITHDQDVARSGFYRIDLQTGASRKIVEDTKAYSTAYAADVNEVEGEFTFIAQDMQSPPDVWIASVPKRTARQITRINDQIDAYELGRARLVEWRGIQGQTLRGTLLLPSGYKAGRRYPLVVWIYGGANGSESINHFGIEGFTASSNFHVLSTRGYAVLYPDAPLRTGTPMRDLADTVMPGVNKVIELGIADAERLAVMGHSYGSYSTLALVAQTNRFKAAVISAVMEPDLFSSYLRMTADGKTLGTGYYEHGQGNIGGTPWQYRDRYLSNSPLFYFDRIETPLLMGQGDQDTATPLRGADGVFVGLRRLGKEVEYRLYEGEEHSITRKANVIDFWQRQLDFLAEHLDVALDDKGAIVFDDERAGSRPKMLPAVP